MCNPNPLQGSAYAFRTTFQVSSACQMRDRDFHVSDARCVLTKRDGLNRDYLWPKGHVGLKDIWSICEYDLLSEGHFQFGSGHLDLERRPVITRRQEHMERGVVIGGILVASSLMLALLLNSKSSHESAPGPSTHIEGQAAPITSDSPTSPQEAAPSNAEKEHTRISSLPGQSEAVPRDPTIEHPAL